MEPTCPGPIRERVTLRSRHHANPRRKINGAAEESDLELSGFGDILADLEDWARVLEAEPEVIHRLRGAFETGLDGEAGSGSTPETDERAVQECEP